MNDVKVLELEKGRYCLDKNEIKRVIKHKRPIKWYRENKEGIPMPIVPKYKRTYDPIADFKENDLERKDMIVSEEIIHDEKNRLPNIRIVVLKYGDVQSSMILSRKQIKKLIDKLYERFDKGFSIMRSKLPIMNFSNETKIIIALLNSPSYQITIGDLEVYGISNNTANATINKLISKKVLQRCGKIGRNYLYTTVCSKDELQKLFGGNL